jgi:hypothetical protein
VRGAGLRAVPDGEVGEAGIIVPKTVSNAPPPAPWAVGGGGGHRPERGAISSAEFPGANR